MIPWTMTNKFHANKHELKQTYLYRFTGRVFRVEIYERESASDGQFGYVVSATVGEQRTSSFSYHSLDDALKAAESAMALMLEP